MRIVHATAATVSGISFLACANSGRFLVAACFAVFFAAFCAGFLYE